MFRKLVAVVVGVVMTLQLQAGAALALGYTRDCNINVHYKTIAFQWREKTSPEILGVIGDVRVRNLRPCTNPSTSLYDMPAVLGASLQYRRDNAANLMRVVQLGYGKCGRPSGLKCGKIADIPNDGKPHFIYTFIDNNNGGAYLADGWYKAPILGHEYRMKVESFGSDWRFCIRDKTAGEAYVCTFRGRNWGPSGEFAWWGTETNDIGTQNGNSLNEPEIDLKGQYELGTQENWFWITDLGGCSYATFIQPDYYHCYGVNGPLNDLDMIWSHTHAY